jgi:hypothetical protein
MSVPLPKGKWSWKHPRCVGCGTKKVKHRGHGLCRNCFNKKHNKSARRKIQLRRNNERWYAKVKNTKEYQEYSRLKHERWRNSERYKTVLLPRQYLRQKMRCMARNQFYGIGRRLKKYQGVRYKCEVCPDHYITSPIQGHELEKDIYSFEMFKNEMAKLCKSRVQAVRPELKLIDERLLV